MYYIVTFLRDILHYIQFKMLKFFISRRICMFEQTVRPMTVTMHKNRPHDGEKKFFTPLI